jgi:hypothetical protein
MDDRRRNFIMTLSKLASEPETPEVLLTAETQIRDYLVRSADRSLIDEARARAEANPGEISFWQHVMAIVIQKLGAT